MYILHLGTIVITGSSVAVACSSLQYMVRGRVAYCGPK
uniref:Uncharacterized protein n=1 Tax=Anguilla anguilla TaxID=7936 RepID=A0A0E9U7Q8_ANGAN